jgi:hypothetical protein
LEWHEAHRVFPATGSKRHTNGTLDLKLSGCKRRRGPVVRPEPRPEKRILGETAEADALLLPSTLLVPVLPKLLPALVFVDLRFATFLE